MAVAFDNSTKSEGSGSRTFNHTITGNDGGLLVFIGTGKSNTLNVTGVTYNGIALSFVREDQNGSDASTEVWELAAPATGSNQVVVTISGNPDPVMAVAMSFTGTNQTTLVANHAGATGSTSTATVDVTSAMGHFVADMYAEIEGPDSNVGPGQTERRRNDIKGPEPTMASSTEPGAAGTVTMSWTNVDTDWAISAADVDAVAGIARRVMVIT